MNYYAIEMEVRRRQAEMLREAERQRLVRAAREPPPSRRATPRLRVASLAALLTAVGKLVMP